MFWWLQTEPQGPNAWRCPVCGQKFRCENMLVTHWDALHVRTLGLTEETVCLADYCDVFRCDVLRKRRHKTKDDEVNGSPTEQDVEDQESEEVKDDTAAEEEKDPAAMRMECDDKAMVTLHNKCRSVIRQCTIGMLANLSLKDFQDIEDDLDRSICSYLTCERYWDDYDSEVHHIPTIICIVVGLLIVTGFCLCYYGVWILIEHNQINTDQMCYGCRNKCPLLSPQRADLMQYGYRQGLPEPLESRATTSRCGRL